MFLSGLFTPAARVLANAPETGDYLFMRTASGNHANCRVSPVERRLKPAAASTRATKATRSIACLGC
jgi:hypothetical protein